MKKTVLILTLAMILTVAAIIGIGFYKIKSIQNSLKKNDNNQEGFVSCTEESRACPDGSSVDRVGPDCSFALCPGEIAKSSNEIIKEIFIKKYPQYAQTLEIKIDKEENNHVRGIVVFSENAPGGIFLAAKVSGEWQVVHEGNGQIPCTLLGYGFPSSILTDCAQ